MKNIVCTLFIISSFFAKAQVVGTPYLPITSTDRTRLALVAVGCTSCAAYDAATDTALVPITLAEYNSILANVSGASIKGIDNFSSIVALGTINEMVGPGTNFSVLPANSYIAAVAFVSYTTSTGAIAVTCSSSQTGASICLTSTSSSLTWTPNVVKYFAVKKPTSNCGNNTFLGRISGVGSVSSSGKATGSLSYIQNSTASCGIMAATTINYSPALQVIATTTRPW